MFQRAHSLPKRQQQLASSQSFEAEHADVQCGEQQAHLGMDLLHG